MNESDIHSNSWRDYQRRLRRISRKKYYMKRAPWLGFMGFASFLILTILFYGGSWLFAHLGRDVPSELKEVEKTPPWELSRSDLPKLLEGLNSELCSGNVSHFLRWNGRGLSVETSLDTRLQDFVQDLLKRSLTHQAAVVVMNPENGQVLSMASYEREGNGNGENLCLKAEFPAASLFKIVAAAAAIEAKGFTPERTMAYRGGKYTLYRSQLEKDPGRSSNRTSFKKAFSGSINPVFGRIGIHHLGNGLLSEYAARFLFNSAIPFDLPLAVSRIKVPDDDFGLAEIASGFNKRTLISPLHAAVLTAAVVNRGNIMAPWLVKQISSETGEVLYRAKPSILSIPVKEETARDLRVLMEETVVTGTCRRAFKPLRRREQFKNFEFGAKTGTINDSLDRYKYDWVTAYALPGKGEGGVCLAILAVHGEKLGIRAKDIGRYIIRHHFSS